MPLKHHERVMLAVVFGIIVLGIAIAYALWRINNDARKMFDDLVIPKIRPNGLEPLIPPPRSQLLVSSQS